MLSLELVVSHHIRTTYKHQIQPCIDIVRVLLVISFVLTPIALKHTTRAKTNFLCQGFRKLSYYRHTNTNEISYCAALQVVEILG